MANEVGVTENNDAVCPLCQSPYVPLRNKLIRTTKDVLSCVEHFRDKRQEYLICLSLDSGQRLIARRIVTIGLLDQALAHPREVFAPLLQEHAAAVIVVHNHPSGDPSPSKEDIKTTQQLVAAGLILGIPVKDHFIVAGEEWFSFLSRRLL